MIVVRVIVDVFLILGIFFVFSGVIGIIRMPDTLCRLQAGTIISSTGVPLVTLGAAIWAVANNNYILAGKIIVAGIFIFCTKPVVNHVLAKLAYIKGEVDFNKMQCDEYGRDNQNE